MYAAVARQNHAGTNFWPAPESFGKLETSGRFLFAANGLAAFLFDNLGQLIHTLPKFLLVLTKVQKHLGTKIQVPRIAPFVFLGVDICYMVSRGH